MAPEAIGPTSRAVGRRPYGVVADPARRGVAEPVVSVPSASYQPTVHSTVRRPAFQLAGAKSRYPGLTPVGKRTSGVLGGQSRLQPAPAAAHHWSVDEGYDVTPVMVTVPTSSVEWTLVQGTGLPSVPDDPSDRHVPVT